MELPGSDLQSHPEGVSWQVIFVFDRGFADEKLIRYLERMGANHIMRVPKNCGIEAFEYRRKLSSFGQWGYFRNVSYHLGKPIEMNLLCAENDRDNDRDKDDPVFLVSDMDDLISLIHRKNIIERELRWRRDSET